MLATHTSNLLIRLWPLAQCFHRKPLSDTERVFLLVAGAARQHTAHHTGNMFTVACKLHQISPNTLCRLLSGPAQNWPCVLSCELC